MAWTNEQQAAIDSRGQTLLLSAAAGSGKTAVLVERIIRRLLDKEYPIDITELLVVTFTKAAAAEMRDRIGTALMKALSETKDPRVERQLALLPSAQISTLHAFCQHVIRKYFYTIDLDPAFSIAGEEELNLLRRQVLEDVFLSYYEDDEKASILYPLADMFGSDRGDDILMDTVSRMYTYARSLAWPEHWLKEAARAYDVAPDAVIDDMVWAGPIKDAVRRILEEDAHLYDGVLYHLRQREAFAPACDTFVAEQAALRQAAQARSWNDLSRFVRAIDFPRLKSLRKLSDDDKAVLKRSKKVRDDVKKDVIKTLQSVYFSATPEEWLDGMRAMKPVMDGLVTLTLDFAKAYGAAKKEKGWIDFSDLEHFCLQILCRRRQPKSCAASMKRSSSTNTRIRTASRNSLPASFPVRTTVSWSATSSRASIVSAWPTRRCSWRNTSLSAAMKKPCSAASTWGGISAAFRSSSTP